MAFEFLLFIITNTCLCASVHYSHVMAYSDDLVIVLLAAVMLRLHKILNRVHNRKQLSNLDMTTLVLLLTASLIHTHLMRLAVFTVLTYGCATWVCRWVVADAKRKDEEDAAEDAEDTADTAPTNTPRSRSGSVVLHDDGNVTDPDMPPLVDADEEARTEPYVAKDYHPYMQGWMPTVGAESGTNDMVARPPRGTTFPHVPVETHEPTTMGVTVDEYLSELSYLNARKSAVTEAEAAYQREGADVVNGATYPPAEEEKVFQALRDKYF